MPTPFESFIETRVKPRIQVALAPAQNAIHSLLLLTEAEKLSGLSEWVVETANKLSPEEMKKHYWVMVGFYYAIMPTRAWDSFPAYLNHLATMDPEDLRNKLLQVYSELPVKSGVTDILDAKAALTSEDNYIAFLRQRYDDTHIDEELERWAYSYIIDPPAMQELIVTHLQTYWEKYLKQEWERVLPTLQKAVEAFRNVDLNQMDNYEAAKFVLGQAVADEHWETKCNKAEGLIFVPSLHVGPYFGKFSLDNYQGFIFRAGLPDTVSAYVPELSLADIYVRLNALADETRLQILKYISNEGEACSTEIIDALDLSQSAASRHLTQLTAIGYLTARRIESAKCYRLDKERIGNTFDTIKSYLRI
jgi:DNA-binding transcriptional ArsR family regulator